MRVCGSQDAGERRRLHDAMSKQGLSREELFEQIVAMFGCAKKDGQ